MGKDAAIGNHLAGAIDASWCALVDNADLYIENEAIPACPAGHAKSFHVFHSAEFMRRLFPRGTIIEPVLGEMQHCCVLAF
jgi:hypothetical protein